MAYFAEQVTNTVARRSSGSERSKWRDAGVDPEFLYSPSDFQRRQAAESLAELQVAARLEADTVRTLPDTSSGASEVDAARYALNLQQS